MALTPQDYRKVLQTHRRGTRAAQPAPATVLEGTLYFVTDEGVTERSNGAAWESYSGAGGATGNDGAPGVPGLDGVDYSDEPLIIPGSRGAPGSTGLTGNTGSTGPAIYLTQDEIEPEPPIPGQQGIQGVAGASGALTKIEEQSPTGTAITFSSLGSYTHLMVIFNVRGTTAATQVFGQVTVNGDTGANYDSQRTSFGSSAFFASQVAANFLQIMSLSAATSPANYPSNGILYIPDYRNTTFFKTFQINQAGEITALSAGNIVGRTAFGWWRNTGAITSITFTLAAGNYVSGSKFSLYGIS